MLKSLGKFVSPSVGIALCAVAALAMLVALTPVTARADSQTQTLIHTANSAVGIQANFLPFNPALGTLQSLDFQLEGSSTMLEQETFLYTLTISLDDPFSGAVSGSCEVVPMQTVSCSVQTALVVDTKPADLLLAENLSAVTFMSTFSTLPLVTLGADSVDFSLIYNYKPAVITGAPEPGTNSLLFAGLGIFGLIGLAHKRNPLRRR
jgi:hypothetical protein